METAVALEKISIRPFQLFDADDLIMCMKDDRVAQFCRWDTLKSREDAEIYLKEVAMPHPWFRAICLENRAVGFIWVKMGTNEFRYKGEIGYALAFHCWGQGIATAAVEMVVSSIFREFPEMERLEALVHPENRGSQRVLEKAGFLKEGLLKKYVFHKGKIRDLFIFSFLSKEPIS